MNDPYALLADARQGNQEALGRLLQMYRPYLKLISRLEFNPRMQSRLDGSDLIQETALQVHRESPLPPVGTMGDNDVTSPLKDI